MIKTYTYKIKPNKKVEQKFNHWVGICRYVFNVSKQLKEVSYRRGLKLSAYDIQKQLTDAKKEHTFLKEVHSQTLQVIIERLDNSFKRFFKGAGYPKWASKKRMWFYGEMKGRNPNEKSMEEIKSKYGSETLKNKEKKQIAS